ncbi:DNA-3-methyladenine glycosylase family protein [Candidatus Poriferisodalis sp.]|uniref:DNA-3-methyladenine glycosylase family protein n=1 Tax=Candidatus Poriferisodalis sp. TaxID=3101277 RepID=UPI003B02DB54
MRRGTAPAPAARALRAESPDLVQRLEFDFELDAGRTLGRVGGKGRLGPVLYDGPAIWRAADTPDGEATLRITRLSRTAEICAWGPGAEAAAERVPALLGAHDDPSALVPQDAVVAGWVRRWPARRLTATGTIWEHVVPTVCGQKVPGLNAKNSWQGILRRWGRQPPGPAPSTLRLPPMAELMASFAYHEFHRFDIERRRAEAIIAFARRAATLERLAHCPPEQARKRLQAIRGIGPWTASIVVLLCHGDPDSVIIGDYQIPSYVTWHLSGERRGDDDRMLELLEPYRGQRARVQALAKSAGPPPRHGPRMPLQDLQHR